jgi:prepilin-type processing-associated H-X9-DG protein
MLMPALQKARERAITINCLNNQKQVYTTLMFYVSDHRSRGVQQGWGVEPNSYSAFKGWAGFLTKGGVYAKPNNAIFACPAMASFRTAFSGQKIANWNQESGDYAYGWMSYPNFDPPHERWETHKNGLVNANGSWCFVNFVKLPYASKMPLFVDSSASWVGYSGNIKWRAGTDGGDSYQKARVYLTHNSNRYANTLYYDGHGKTEDPFGLFSSAATIWAIYAAPRKGGLNEAQGLFPMTAPPTGWVREHWPQLYRK